MHTFEIRYKEGTVADKDTGRYIVADRLESANDKYLFEKDMGSKGYETVASIPKENVLFIIREDGRKG